MDGFGICWWSDAFEEYNSGVKGDVRPVIYKNTRPPLNDLVLRSLARGVQTKAVVAHIRAGTGEYSLHAFDQPTTPADKARPTPARAYSRR